MQNPSETILESPGWATLIFGDGYLALMQGGIENENSNGERIVSVTIKPHSSLRKRYNIQEQDLNNSGNIENYQMHKEDIIVLNQWDDANRTILYIKNYLHQETDLCRVNWELRKQLQEERTKRVIIEGYLIRLSEDLTLAKQNPAEYISQGLELIKALNVDLIESMRGRKEDEK
ncbi:MAG: hypothetical protein WC758_07700 [Candidatus Woesearchaeota archaeon]|jgi:hypothetical protein